MGAAFLASLCCIGPVLFVTLGVGAGLASRFEPLRPVFSILTVGLLAIGFYTVYGRRPANKTGLSRDVDGACIAPRSRTRDKALLWIATLVALLLLTFPQWSWLLV
jgi:mercuric ion transport protein